jgi:hypothetical protein
VLTPWALHALAPLLKALQPIPLLTILPLFLLLLPLLLLLLISVLLLLLQWRDRVPAKGPSNRQGWVQDRCSASDGAAVQKTHSGLLLLWHTSHDT